MSPRPLRAPARALAASLTAATMGLGIATALPVAHAEAAPARAQASANNNQIAYAYLVAKGLGRHQAAAVVGNLMQESGSPINPRARQRGGPGMGIAQWSRGARWNALVKYAHATHRSEYALVTQLDFLWIELHGSESRAMRKLLGTGSIPAATASFSRYYERCAPRWCANANRTRNATQVFSSYAAR